MKNKLNNITKIIDKLAIILIISVFFFKYGKIYNNLSIYLFSSEGA